MALVPLLLKPLHHRVHRCLSTIFASPVKLKKAEITSDYLVLADSSEPKSITEVDDAGFWIEGVKKPPGSKAWGIQLLQQYDIVICGDSPNLKKEIATYAWAQDKHGNSLNEPEDGFDHCMDSLRYYAMYMLGDAGTVKSGSLNMF